MSITLNSTLKAAQDGQSHHIIAEILSKPMIPDIPFVGQFLTNETIDEQRSNSITHSSNRICLIYKFDTNKFKYVYTDTDRTYFNFITLDRADLGYHISETTIEASICELSDGNLGMIFTTQTTSNIYLRYAKLSPTGSVLSTGLIETYSKSSIYNLVSPFVISLADGSYMLVYLKGEQNLPLSSGTYTGTSNSEYEVYITDEGTQTTAQFYWRKDSGAWSAKITCTGTPQLLDEGVYITFTPGTYYVGATYKITVTAARKATGFITILSNALNNDQVIIGSETYTYKTALVGGGNPNEVVIDIYGMEISLENLRCAIMDDNFEGTGEGIRYGNGTTAHPDVTAVRQNYRLTITAKVAGAAGNSITITVPATRFSASAMSGGADSVIGDVQASVSSKIVKRTSSDFSNWSAEADISIGNIGAQEKEHVSLCQLSNGDIWILFDNYDDWFWSNCYYSVSTDNGLSWGNATALTSYNSPQAKGLHPMLVQKTLTEVYAVYHEDRGALHIDKDSPGWPGGKCSITGIHVYNNKIYAVSTYTYVGTKYFIAVIEIDIATWRITDSWTTTSIPAFHTVFANENVWWGKNRSAGKWVVIGTMSNPEIAVLNIETDTIKHYFFYDWAKYAIVKNVNWETPYPGSTERALSGTYVDETNNRLYIVLTRAYSFSRIVDIVYIDLTADLVPGSTYNVVTVYTSENYFTEVLVRGIRDGDFRVYPGSQIALLSSSQGTSSWIGMLVVFNAPIDNDWTIWKKYEGGYGNDLPFNGIRKCVYLNGIVYGTFPYNAVSQPERKGICKIILDTDDFYYVEPVWPVRYDNYNFRDICITDDNMLIITSYSYGITIYDPASGTWTLYNNDSVLGLTPDDKDAFWPITYDPTSGLVITGVLYDPTSGTWCGVVAFNRYGTLKKPKYRIGTYTVAWNFAAASDFIVGYLDFDVSVTLDPVDNGIYAFWTNQNAQLNEMSVKWAKETPEFDLTPYVVRSVPIVIKRDIEADSPNTITFTVSHGHLFDPFNDLSLWRNYVAKGHKLVVRMGEKISGVDYWQNVGSFLITERSMITYERGKYPLMDIKAEDKRILWDNHEIDVTDWYDNTPENILAHILEYKAGENPLDIDIPTFGNSTTLYHQWVETTILDIIKQICDRYGYFPKITVDDDFTCRKISDQNTITHTYNDLKQILTYTTDDTFSDYTNKIIVTCEGRDFQERVFPKERVLFLTGSMGWWGCKKTRREYYSENREKQVKNPELRKLESAEGIMFELAGKVKEHISEEDTNNKYVDVTIEAPDLRPALVAAIAIYTGASYIKNFFGDMSKTAAFVLIVNILASIANYQFEIWGNPVGYIRHSWQAVAEDTDLQNLTGKTIEKKIEEPLAYYINEAQDVANHEMLVLRLQRKRAKISKIAHLQDEEGDTIQIKHPYSQSSLKIFITTFTRSLKISESPDGEGHFIDDIEGWII